MVESFKALNLPFMWRMGPTSSNIEETAAVLQGLNPIDIGTSAIMMLQLDEVSAVKKSLPKVVVVEVRSEKDINSWMSVWAEVFKI